MSDTLDRQIEKNLCALIAASVPPASTVQVVPFLQGKDDAQAVLPRVVIKAESQDTPELFQAKVYRVEVEIQHMTNATNVGASGLDVQIVAAIDAVVENCSLAQLLTSEGIRIYGAVAGGKTQETEELRFVRTRDLTLHGKVM